MGKRITKIALSICSMICFAIAGIGMAFDLGGYERADAYEIVLDNASDLAEEYTLGELFFVPSGKIEGVTATSTAVVSPAGNTAYTSEVSLTETGEYTVIWYATVNGVEVSASRTFMVKESVFSTSGSVKWSYKQELEHGSQQIEDGIKRDGITVAIEPESTFRYNRPIELADPNVPIAKIYPHQGILNLENAVNKVESYQFNIEARNILLTLTDCYDPSNTVTIDLEWGENKGSHRNYWNFRAGAKGQTAHGLRDKASTLMCTVDGRDYAYYLAPGQGATACNITDYYGLTVYYDMYTQRVYIESWRYASGAYASQGRRLIADLANPTIYPTNPFKGFKGSEVYLTFSAKNYLSNKVNIDISEIGGLEGDQILKAGMNDTKAPRIAIDETLEEAGTILVAKNEKIAVPDAYVYDVTIPYGTKATKAVYYNYDPNSSSNTAVSLKNGEFTPTRIGTYTIVYSATDAGGNTGYATVELQSMEGSNNKAVDLVVQAQANAQAGENLTVPACTINGLYTDASVLKKYVSFDGGEEELITGNAVFLKNVGNYVISYVYETPLKTYVAETAVTTTASNIVRIEVPALPEYLIKNATYTLDTAYAYEYKGKQPTSYLAETYMSSDGGAYEMINSDAVKITASSTVKFKYVHGSQTEYSDVIPVADVGFGETLHMEKYFQASNPSAITSTATSTGVQYTTDGVATSTSLKFVNQLYLSLFAIEFSFLSGDGTYVAPGSLTVTLVDFYNRDNQVSIGFRVSGSGDGAVVRIFIDGEEMGMLEQSVLDTRIGLVYTGSGFNVSGNIYKYDVNFTSNKILLKLDMAGIDGTASLNVRSVCDRKLSNASYDKSEPALTSAKMHTGYQKFGSVITITTVEAFDLIAPFVKSGLRIVARKPDGSYARSVDGVLLDGTCSTERTYELKLESLGIFSVLYEYTDQNGDYASLGYSPITKDEALPTLSVSGVAEKAVVDAQWGAKVAIAGYSYSDDITAQSEMRNFVTVFSPTGTTATLDSQNRFYAKEKGNYTVVYSVFDEMGNFRTFLYVIKVA